MNYIKIQKKLLDNFLKKDSVFLCQTLDDYHLISDNRYQCFKIPKSEMWLNIEKMMDGRNEPPFDRVMKIDGEDGAMTQEMLSLDGKTVVKIASKNNFAYVDKKLIDRYEIKEGLHFTISKNIYSPLLIWEGENLCGLVCPTKVKG